MSTQCREAITKYLESEDLEPKHCEVMLQLVELYGLLHPVQPAGLTAQKKTWRLLKRGSPLERQLRSETARERARIEVQAQLYQRVRGDAVISYGSTPEDRAKHRAGRRPELEVAVSSSRRAIFTRRGRPHSGSCGRMSGRDTGTV